MNSFSRPYNVLIADDHRLITEGISRILQEEEIIGRLYTVHNGREAVVTALSREVHCVIMDIHMPDLDGLEATRLIKKEKPGIRIIVVSMLDDVPTVSKMMRAGADGFLHKCAGKSELINALNKVMGGETYITPDILKILVAHMGRQQIPAQDVEKSLTPREIEIVRHIAEGLTNREISARLFISTGTVDTHRKNILAKLQLKNTALLVKYALEHKLL